MKIDYRWADGNTDHYERFARELVTLEPDVILTNGGAVVRALQQANQTVPIVFVAVADPVGGRVVTSLARPGGSATGFTIFDYDMSGKWLELLKEIAPDVTRVAVILDPSAVAGPGQLGAIQALAPSVGVEVTSVDARKLAEIEHAISSLGSRPNSGAVVLGGGAVSRQRTTIIKLAALHRLPTTYPLRFYITEGGLICYGPDLVDHYRRAAGYVDRILKGAKPSDLPVQASTKYDLAINLKAANALGLAIPPMLLARATEVIE